MFCIKCGSQTNFIEPHFCSVEQVPSFERSYSFDQVTFKHKKNICNSRLDVNIKSEVIKGVFLDNPIISANMSTVTHGKFAVEMSANGGLGVIHRAYPKLEDYLTEVKYVASKTNWVASSIGVGANDFELAQELIKNGSNIIVIDIANGYADSVINMGRKIKQYSPSTKVVVGNTANIGLLEETVDYADAIKVGIAPGASCETRHTAGCGEGQMSVVLKFKERSKQLGIPIISDGGVREGADYVKAILGGASSVMIGSVLARCPESAAELQYHEGRFQKIFAGMASRYVQDKWKQGLKSGTCAEGKTVYLDLGEPVANLMERYAGALRSGITYAGGKDIKTAQESVEFIRIK